MTGAPNPSGTLFWRVLVPAVLGSLLLVEGAAAGPIQTMSSTVTFSAAPVNVWGSGPINAVSEEVRIGAAIGKYRSSTNSPAQDYTVVDGIGCVLGVCAGVEAGLSASAIAQLNARALVTGGSVGAKVTTSFEVTAPQAAVANGERFTVSSQARVLQGSVLNVQGARLQASVGASLGFEASVYGEVCAGACTSGSVDLNVLPRTDFDIISFDTSAPQTLGLFGLGVELPLFDKAYNIHAGPCPVKLTPLSCSFNPTPKIGEVQINAPAGSFAAGVLNGNVLTASSDQDGLRLQASLSGLAEMANGGTVDVLQQRVSVPGASAVVKLLDASAQVEMKLRQQYSLDVKPVVRLEFSRAVSQLAPRNWTGWDYTCTSPQGGSLTASCKPGEVIFVPGVEAPPLLPDECLVHYSASFVLNVCEAPVKHYDVAAAGDVYYKDGVVTLDAGSSGQFYFEEEEGLDMGYLKSISYFLDNPVLTPDIDLTVTPSLGIELLCAQFELAGSSAGGCLLDQTYSLGEVKAYDILNMPSVMNGFSSFAFDWNATTDGTVPEPSGIALLLTALAASALSRQSRGARTAEGSRSAANDTPMRLRSQG